MDVWFNIVLTFIKPLIIRHLTEPKRLLFFGQKWFEDLKKWTFGRLVRIWFAFGSITLLIISYLCELVPNAHFFSLFLGGLFF